MGGEMTDSDDGGARHGTAAAAPLGEGGFVVVDREEVARDDYDVPEAGLNESGSVNDQGEAGAASGPSTVPYVPETFQAIGSSLASGSRSSARPSSLSSSTSGATPPGRSSSTSSSTPIVQPDHDDEVDPAVIDAAGADDPSPPFDIASAALAATEVVYEFLYAYAIVVYHEAMALVERLYALVGATRRAWRARGPLPPNVRRAVKHKLFPVVLALVLSLLVILPAYCLMPRGQPRLSAREWQARYEELSSKHNAALVRSRLKYDSLAGRHVELQAEYEAVLDDLKKQAPAGADEAYPDSCTQDAVSGPMAMARDALLLAEQAASDMFRHFSEGLRDDVHEIAELLRRYRDDRFGDGSAGGDGGGSGSSSSGSGGDGKQKEEVEQEKACGLGGDGGGKCRADKVSGGKDDVKAAKKKAKLDKKAEKKIAKEKKQAKTGEQQQVPEAAEAEATKKQGKEAQKKTTDKKQKSVKVSDLKEHEGVMAAVAESQSPALGDGGVGASVGAGGSGGKGTKKKQKEKKGAKMPDLKKSKVAMTTEAESRAHPVDGDGNVDGVGDGGGGGSGGKEAKKKKKDKKDKKDKKGAKAPDLKKSKAAMIAEAESRAHPLGGGGNHDDVGSAVDGGSGGGKEARKEEKRKDKKGAKVPDLNTSRAAMIAEAESRAYPLSGGGNDGDVGSAVDGGGGGGGGGGRVGKKDGKKASKKQEDKQKDMKKEKKKDTKKKKKKNDTKVKDLEEHDMEEREGVLAAAAESPPPARGGSSAGGDGDDSGGGNGKGATKKQTKEEKKEAKMARMGERHAGKATAEARAIARDFARDVGGHGGGSGGGGVRATVGNKEGKEAANKNAKEEEEGSIRVLKERGADRAKVEKARAIARTHAFDGGGGDVPAPAARAAEGGKSNPRRPPRAGDAAPAARPRKKVKKDKKNTAAAPKKNEKPEKQAEGTMEAWTGRGGGGGKTKKEERKQGVSEGGDGGDGNTNFDGVHVGDGKGREENVAHTPECRNTEVFPAGRVTKHTEPGDQPVAARPKKGKNAKGKNKNESKNAPKNAPKNDLKSKAGNDPKNDPENSTKSQPKPKSQPKYRPKDKSKPKNKNKRKPKNQPKKEPKETDEGAGVHQLYQIG
eukprot:jgi/Undpi1/1856/HiC_scaffold_12.g05243.m1